MRILPPELQIGDNDGFKPEFDLFNRAELGQRLLSLVTRVEDPMVLALDAPWGSGKTVFLKMWAGELRQRGLPVVYFDAFSADHADDPFVVLSAEIIALAQEKSDNEKPVQAFTDKAVSATKILASGIGRLAAKAAVRAATAGALSAADLSEEAIVGTTTDAAGLADKEIADLLTGVRKRRDTMKAFRDALSELPQLLSVHVDAVTSDPADLGQKQRPLVFIIDELDRCTPPFALALLERMKHFFSVSNVQFVLGVHLEQLERSVRAAYGSDIDARTYLQKFIHFSVPLVDTPSHSDSATVNKYVAHLSKTLVGETTQPDTAEQINEFLAGYSLHSKLSLRTIERIYTTVAVCLASLPEKWLAIGPLLAGLAILKTMQPSLYVAAKNGELRYEQVREVFGFSQDADHRSYDREAWAASWWRLACDEEAPAELIEQFRSTLMRYNIHEREELLPTLTNKVLEHFERPAPLQ